MTPAGSGVWTVPARKIKPVEKGRKYTDKEDQQQQQQQNDATRYECRDQHDLLHGLVGVC